jgi:excisionase family DNA binding protein
MTSDEVAALLRVDVVTIRRLVSRGEMPAYRVGSEYRFAETDLEDYLRRQRVSGSDEADSPSPDESSTSPWHKAFLRKRGGDRELFERFFTDSARRVLGAAQEEARRLQHNFIGTEHLLLGLLRQEESVAAQVLRHLNVQLDIVRERVEFIVGKENRVVKGEIGLTGRAKMVLELAVEEAQSLRHGHVGTEHLLLGLVREGEGIAADVLQKLGADLSSVRAKTIQVVNAGVKVPSPPPVPEQAASLLVEGEQGLTCSYCGACCPGYFRFCFNCSTLLKHENLEE